MSRMPEPGRPVESALRAIAESMDEARPRRPEDIDDPDVPVAATVVILREGARGPEVLMMERPDRGSFAGAWVFPGGRIEPIDAVGADEPEPVVARRAGVRETFEEVGIALDADELLPMSRWDPPPGIALRIRTWFFAARAVQTQVVLSADEVVAAQWMRPEEVLRRHARGELTLYPPTWVTLHGLSGQRDVEAALSVVRLRGVEEFQTIAAQTPGGPALLWHGDAEYAEFGAGEAPARHRLETGALPWRYLRTD